MMKTDRKNKLLHFCGWLVLAAAALGVVVHRDAVRNRVTSVLAAGDVDPIPLQVLERTRYVAEVPAFGEIIGLRSVPVTTPQMRSGGLKIAWLMEEGRRVEPGDVVVRFDDTDAQLNLEKEQTTLEANRERLRITEVRQENETAVLDLDRAEARLEYEYAMGVLPEDETIFSKWHIIEARIDADFAQKRMENLDHRRRVQERIARSDRQILVIEKNKAMAEVDIARQTLDSLELRAPSGGLVLYRRDHRNEDPKIGDETWRGQVLVEIVNLDALQARIHVLERDAGGLREGQEVRIQLDAVPGREYRGTIRSLGALPQPLERGSPLRYLSCEVEMPGAAGDLRWIKPGMPLQAHVTQAAYDSCFVVPASAIVAREAQTFVYVSNDTNYESRPVKLGSSPHGLGVILSGVEEGEVLALQNPFESRKSYLPDFTKGIDADGSLRRGMRRMFRR